MERERVKLYLRKIQGLEYAIQDRTRQIKNLRPLMGIKGMTYNDDRVQTSPDGQGFTRVADQIADLEMEVVKLSKERQKIIGMVEAMPKQYHSRVLYDVYALGLSLEETAEEINLSYGRTSHIHIEALDDFENIYKLANNSNTFGKKHD